MERIKKRVSILICLTMLITLFTGFGVSAKGNTLKGNALNGDTSNGKYGISISVSGPDGEGNYSVKVKVKNDEADFSGSVRLILADDNFGRINYETEISVAKGGEKEFVVKIPTYTIYDASDVLYAYLVDNKGKLCYQDKFPKMFQASNYSMQIGILSDDYDALSYFDCAGEKVWLVVNEYSMLLRELNKDNIKDELSACKFLIIDNYDTSVLSDEQIQSIENWVTKQGGCLIIGTGNNGLKCINNFSDGFFEIQLSNEVMTASPNDPSNSGNLPIYVDTINVMELNRNFLSLTYSSAYGREYDSCTISRQKDEGSITVAPYMFSDEDIKNSGNSVVFTNTVLQQAIESSGIITTDRDDSTYWYDYNECYSALQGEIDFNINGIKLVIILFVLIVGPVSYLVLKLMNKREWYFAIIPVLSLITVGAIFLLGRGMRIKNVQATSVTIEYSEEGRRSTAYVECYSPDSSEWKVKADNRFDVISPAYGDYDYSPNTAINYENYKTRILKSTEGNILGYVPKSSFAETVFKLSGEGQSVGKIELSDIDFSGNIYKGKVTNNTNYDFPYVLVTDSGRYIIIRDLKKGQTVELSTVAKIHSWYTGELDTREFRYTAVNNEKYEEGKENGSLIAALAIGMCDSYRFEATSSYVFGVAGNYTKVTDDKNCDEKAFVCIVNKVKR